MIQLRLRHLTLLAVYFAAGLVGLASVSSTFFVKEHLVLTPEQLISIGIWASLPWSLKLLFGAVIDRVSIFGNNRKSYLLLGSGLMALSTVLLVDAASTRVVEGVLGQAGAWLLAGFLGSLGAVLADIIADVQTVEYAESEAELKGLQVWSRIAISAGGVLGAAVAGPLASAYPPAVVFGLTGLAPAIVALCVFLTPVSKVPHEDVEPRDLTMLIGAVAFALVAVVAGLFGGSWGPTLAFSVNLLILCYLFSRLLPYLAPSARNGFVLSVFAIFLFRVTPGVGPGLSWFYIDRLGFDEAFFGHLGLVANITSFVALLVLAPFVTRVRTVTLLSILTLSGLVLSLPDILVYYGMHERLGISARSLILADTALLGPLGNLSMIPLGIIIAQAAPASQRALYMSLTASLMNLALMGGDVLTGLLNRLFVVTREDFSQLGLLLTSSLGIGTALSILGLSLIRKA